MTNAQDAVADDLIETAPSNFTVRTQGFERAEDARFFERLLEQYVRTLSCFFDLSQLDGVTAAFDYSEALLDLDRGYNATIKLRPTEGTGVGVAMTPRVMRNGELKSHIMLNAHYVLPLSDNKHEHYKHALHTLAHECAHVESIHRYNTAFPNVLLRRVYANAWEGFKSEATLACWDEYSATWRSARVGQDPTASYEELFLASLGDAREKANESIIAYRVHGDVSQVFTEVCSLYGNLLKYAAYHLGNMAGRQLSIDDLPQTKEALDGHWFAPYFERLDMACREIAKGYGVWEDQSALEVIGELADEIVTEGGINVIPLPDGTLRLDIPFTPETMPYA